MTTKEKAKVLRESAERLRGLDLALVAIEDMEQLADSLDPPCLNVIPEGHLCWGLHDRSGKWRPCVANGRGYAHDAVNNCYSVVRLIRPDLWPAGHMRWYVLWKDGVQKFYLSEGVKHNDEVIYYEEKPNGTT